MSMSPTVARRLEHLSALKVNYDVDALDLAHPGPGWHVDDRLQALPGEAPGPPEPEGSFAIASRLIRGYEFADPSLVRAHYDHDAPLEGRNMLLELRALNLVHVYVGVRVHEVYEMDFTHEGRTVHTFGWCYRTLEGHVERGQMNWEVWKWPDSGEVAFHVHAVSRPAPISNPFVRIGFRVLRSHERAAFLDSTNRRMRTFTELGLRGEGPEAIRDASDALTARSGGDPGAHDEIAGDAGRARR